MKTKKSSIKTKAKGSAKTRQQPSGRAAGRKPSRAQPVVKAGMVKPPGKEQEPRPSGETESSRILAELKEIRQLLSRESPVTGLGEESLEGGVDSLRRLLSEMIEKRTEWVLSRMVSVRAAASDGPRMGRELDNLIEELGARPFNAQAMDHVDPLIHSVEEERPTREMPEGVVLETLHCGYRASSGRVLAKARVAVSRRA